MNKRKIKRMSFFEKAVLTINIIVAIALLLSYLAPNTDPRDFSIIAILGFSYQGLFLINVITLIYWVARLKIYLLISSICIMLGFKIIMMNFVFRSSPQINKIKPKNGIRIMAYNVRGFDGIDIHENDPIQNEIAQLVADNHPDIVNFEEFLETKIDSGAKIKLMEKQFSHCFHYFKPFTTGDEYSIGDAIFTKFPIIDTGSVGSPKLLDIRAIFVDIKYNNRVVRIYCIHLGAVNVGGEKSKYLKGDVGLGEASFIKSRLSDAFIRRSYQVSRIKEHMDKCPYPFIIAGDFNDTPISYAVNEIGDGLKNAFIEKGSGLGTTFYSAFPKLHIDYIFANSQFNILNYYEIDKKLSDHKPIISDLELK